MSVIETFEQIEAEGVKTFEDAGVYMVPFLHAKNLSTRYHPLPKARLSGSSIVDALIELLLEAETPVGASNLLIMVHPLYYYHIQKECRSIVDVKQHDSVKGYCGTILGHPFISHVRFRPKTLVVTAKQGNRFKVLVASPNEWFPQESLFT